MTTEKEIFTAQEKLFTTQSKIACIINREVPSDVEAAKAFLARRKKLSHFLMEIREVEYFLNKLDLDDESIPAVSERDFYSLIARAFDYNMFFDGTYVKLVELNATIDSLNTSYAMWCKSTSLVK